MNIIHWKQCQITIQSLSGIWMSKIRFGSRETNFSLQLFGILLLNTFYFIKLKLQKCIALTSEPLDHIILIPIKLGTKHFLIKCVSMIGQNVLQGKYMYYIKMNLFKTILFCSILFLILVPVNYCLFFHHLVCRSFSDVSSILWELLVWHRVPAIKGADDLFWF